MDLKDAQIYSSNTTFKCIFRFIPFFYYSVLFLEKKLRRSAEC